jgi:hypothetical protein
MPSPVGLSGLVFILIFAARSFLPLEFLLKVSYFVAGAAHAARIRFPFFWLCTCPGSHSTAGHRFPVREQPRCRVRSSLIYSIFATPVCFSHPSLLACDFPPWCGSTQVCPRLRAACPSSSFLCPFQVFASTFQFRVGVTLCLICSLVDLMSLLLQCMQ